MMKELEITASPRPTKQEYERSQSVGRLRRRMGKHIQDLHRQIRLIRENRHLRSQSCDILISAARTRQWRLDERKKAVKAEELKQKRLYIFRKLRHFGFRREHSSNGSSSAYYWHPSGYRVRVSDHNVPFTANRYCDYLSGRFTWAIDGYDIRYDRSFFSIGRDIIEIKQTLTK